MTNSNALFNSFSAHSARCLVANPNDKKYSVGYKRWATESVCAFFTGAIDSATVSAMKPFAAIYRLAQAMSFISSTELARDFEKSTAVLVAIVANSKTNIITFKDAGFVMGKSGDNETQSINGLSRARIDSLIGLVSNQTVQTRVSSGLGVNGFFTALGITRKNSANSFEIVNKNHPLVIAYAMKLSKLTDYQFADLLEGKKD